MTQVIARPILGIGYGPANLALSIYLKSLGLLGAAQFLERNAAFGWHQGQLLPGTDIQNHPLRDLGLTIEDSEVSFLRYLQSKGRLLEYLHLNNSFPSRAEYSDYLGWSASQVPATVSYGVSAANIGITRDPVTGNACFTVNTPGSGSVCGRHLVIGTGRSPRIPAVFADAREPSVSHASGYCSAFANIDLRKQTVAVIGSSQSAIEIAIDLIERRQVKTVHLIHRGIGFRLKDTSSYSRRVFLPDFIDYFHALPRQQRARLRAELKLVNYGACDADVIAQLSALEYHDSVTGSPRIRRHPFSEVTSYTATSNSSRLVVTDRYTGTSNTVDVDFTVLATGYRDFGQGPDDEPFHPLLRGILSEFATHHDGVPIVNRDYSLLPRRGSVAETEGLTVHLNGLCEESHGMGDAGALAMVANRARDIGQSLLASLTTKESRPPEIASTRNDGNVFAGATGYGG